ncbi:hypothetical protein K5E40_27715 [Pseudomonas baetica]|uniref:hypothetical protein n=1 Tax=Pseudomonas baetica TaxID=674054 RepID=UPI001C8B1470|nr:hypothetical protein [Pseudomonas baetica]MBX9409450.1 hypothetical protein [Pseudomonas baetica]
MSAILSYKEIMQQMFYYYPIYCRTKIRKNKKSVFSWVEGELEVGYALNEMEESFVTPVENLMLQTAGLVLSAGREPKVAFDFAVAHIKGIIEVHGLAFLMSQLSEQDALQVESDLQLLDII